SLALTAAAPPETYTLSLHDALPISSAEAVSLFQFGVSGRVVAENGDPLPGVNIIQKGTTNGTTTDVDGRYSLQVDNANAVLVFRSEEHTSELQSRENLVCRLLLEKK